MDKSFNDQELSDIMKEIEALEEEFSSDEEIKPEASAVMEELAEMDEEKSVPVEAPREASVLSFAKAEAPTQVKTTAPTTMSFKVQGEMNLELQFEVGGKTIQLDVSETGLTIQMEGGMTFTVPVTEAKSFKKAI